MIKLQTGISTDMDFIKAMKERGQDVNAMFPAETLRDQLDDLSEETKVTFESTNETVLAAVNEGEEPTPEPEPETVDVNFLKIAYGDDEIPEDAYVTEAKLSDGLVNYLETIDSDLYIAVKNYIEDNFEEGAELTFCIDAANEADNLYGNITVTGDISFEFKTETLGDAQVTMEFEEETGGYIVIVELIEKINFKSAVRLDVTGATEDDNPGIVENGDKYEVVKDENTILVTDEGLVPYIGGNIDEPKKWVGILVDLGVKVKGKEYNIEDVDYSDAARWGALNDTTFIMWLTTEKGGEYTFTNLEDKKDKITITVEFAE